MTLLMQTKFNSRLIAGAFTVLTLFFLLGIGMATGRSFMQIPRYEVDIEGVVQDANGNLLDDVTLYITTEILTKPFSEETEIDRYERRVSGKFKFKLPKKVHSMSLTAEKKGCARTSEYCFEMDETRLGPGSLQAKDVVIRLIPAVRPSRLETRLGRCEMTKGGKSMGFSFREWRDIPLKGTPDTAEMCIYLKITGNPKSFWDTNNYSVVLAGAGVEFREAFLLPPLKYIKNHQRFRDELLQAPENGYVSQVEINSPKNLKDMIFYFKTQNGKYGKFWIEGHHVHVRNNYLKVKFKYYYQPDGTRDLAQE